jgi:hypothetical protein
MAADRRPVGATFQDGGGGQRAGHADDRSERLGGQEAGVSAAYAQKAATSIDDHAEAPPGHPGIVISVGLEISQRE